MQRLTRHLSHIDRTVEKVAYWFVFISFCGSIMTYILSLIPGIFKYGWASTAIAGVGLACLLSLSLSMWLLAWRYFNPIPSSRQTATSPSEHKKTPVPASLARGLYIGDIRLGFTDLEVKGHGNMSVRLFNGTNRTVVFSGIAGGVKVSTPDAPRHVFLLPTPSIPAATKMISEPCREWLLDFTQMVHGEPANGILSMLQDGKPIIFDFSGLSIEVYDRDHPTTIEKIALWDGVLYKMEYGFSRLIYLSGRMRA